jgi:hypothetical protein
MISFDPRIEKARDAVIGKEYWSASEKAIIDCFLSALSDEGLVIVPREPTYDMKAAGREVHYRQEREAIQTERLEYRTELCAQIYQAMITALFRVTATEPER